MPVVLLANIAVMLLLMVLVPYSWPDSFPVRPWVAILILVILAGIAVVVGVRRRQKGWNTEASRKAT